MSELDRQKNLKAQLDGLEEQIQNLIQKKKQTRKALDESIQANGDLIMKEIKIKEVADWQESRKNLPPADQEFIDELRRKNDEWLTTGVKLGFWESVEKGVPIPFPIRIPMSVFPEKPTMAHLLVHVGIFESLSQARKAGRTEPLKPGEIRIKLKEGGMKRIILE